MTARALSVVAIVIMLICVIAMAITCATAENELFVMCQPDSCVCVRESARKASTATSELRLGERVLTDGKFKNGYIHCIGLASETGEGWVCAGFLVDCEPVVETRDAWISSKGRVACRRSVNGKRRAWLHNGDKVVVYAWSEEWSVTNQGFVRTEYLSTEEIPSTATRKRK